MRISCPTKQIFVSICLGAEICLVRHAWPVLTTRAPGNCANRRAWRVRVGARCQPSEDHCTQYHLAWSSRPCMHYLVGLGTSAKYHRVTEIRESKHWWRCQSLNSAQKWIKTHISVNLNVLKPNMIGIFALTHYVLKEMALEMMCISIKFAGSRSMP